MPLGFWEGLRQLGIAPHDVIRKAQLPITLMTEPTVSLAQYYAIWQAYADHIDDMAKGIIQLATSFDSNHYPPTVLAAYHARDFRDALKRMARYKQLCPPESLRITEERIVQSSCNGQIGSSRGRRCLLASHWHFFLSLDGEERIVP